MPALWSELFQRGEGVAKRNTIQEGVLTIKDSTPRHSSRLNRLGWEKKRLRAFCGSWRPALIQRYSMTGEQTIHDSKGLLFFLAWSSRTARELPTETHASAAGEGMNDDGRTDGRTDGQSRFVPAFGAAPP